MSYVPFTLFPMSEQHLAGQHGIILAALMPVPEGKVTLSIGINGPVGLQHRLLAVGIVDVSLDHHAAVVRQARYVEVGILLDVQALITS